MEGHFFSEIKWKPQLFIYEPYKIVFEINDKGLKPILMGNTLRECYLNFCKHCTYLLYTSMSVYNARPIISKQNDKCYTKFYLPIHVSYEYS